MPEGSDVSLRVTGGCGEETLTSSTRRATAALCRRKARPADQAAAAQPAAGQALAVRRQARRPTARWRCRSGGADVAKWAFTVDPGQAAGDPLLGRAEARRQRHPGDRLYDPRRLRRAHRQGRVRSSMPLSCPAPVRSTRRPRCRWRCRGAAIAKGAAKATRDLTEHVWAGAKVKVTLVATDDAGQEGRSETKIIMLPERPVLQPAGQGGHRTAPAAGARRQPEAARARPDGRDHAEAGGHVREHVPLPGDHERHAPASSWPRPTTSCATSSPICGTIALGIEEGDLSAAEKRLRQAQEALKQALESGASDEEIDKLMKELRQAMNEYPARIRRARAAESERGPADAAERPRSCARATSNDDGPDREPGQVGRRATRRRNCSRNSST